MAKNRLLRTLTFFLSLLCVSFSFSQSITFNKGMIFQDSLLQESVTQVMEVDDGYLISGYSDFQKTKLIISKLDYQGDTLWFKKYGNDRFYYEPGNGDAMIRTSDSNFALAVTYTDTELLADSRIMVIKFNELGDTLWSHQVYSPDSLNEFCIARGIIETYDKGFMVFGNEGNLTGVMIKTDSLGRKEWMTYYGNHQVSNFREIISIRQTSDSGYIAAGYQADLHSVIAGDARVVKFDKNGTLKWDLGFGSDYQDYAGALIQPTSDGNFLVITHHTTATSGHPYWIPEKSKLQIIKISENADVLLNVLKGDEDKYLYVSDLEVLPDGSFISSGRDIWGTISWMFNFTMEGDSLFFRMINPPNRIDTLRDLMDIKSTSDGGLIASGDYDTPISGEYIRHPWVVKTDRYGCFDMGCDPNGIYTLNQPVPETICKNQQTELSVETYNSSGNVNYNWQSFQNGAWEDIADSTVYQGIHNDTLIINPDNIDVQQELYRCNYFNEIWNFFSDSVKVTFLDTLNIITQPENQSVPYGGQSSFLTLANGERPVNYQWYHNSQPLEGAIDSILLINNVVENDTGTYFCMLTNMCGSIGTDTVRLSITDLGTDDIDGTSRIFASPNPTNHSIRIYSPGIIKVESVLLTDLNGNALLEKHFGKQEILDCLLDLKDLPAGVYFLIISSDFEKITRKILKL